ncbi:hydroxypyruvate isomerase family protein [Nocardia seriolae]|uniref:Hydroxypyruvate isomerase n=1 Tax=Nocardia seriolae TaxID=37332 RepID=A0ABC8AW23_9NOCA|nr:TIM barrel protein [Nocardia seriolae]APA98332.1 Hydroxypyruvate isomerase [Nocardia seriolae]MTJ63006.1 TIM barrel protein [Nocardia seriolae]MTJ75633.1 TIM barrel protein [Nocardia seriolae]MTJ88032.1 TIM barrel protein [Nocardia seriolae]MTK32021.1 TIM barrel protein [Nocardia seriolae]
MRYTAEGALRKFDVHCSILLTDLPLLERPAAAKAAGFEAVEFWWPFGENPVPGDKVVDAFVSAVSDAGVQLIGLNFIDLVPAGRGLVSVPGRETEFRDNIDVTVGIAERLGCRSLNALYGNRIPGVDPVRQDELALENLRLAADAAARIDAQVVLEALNSIESPDYPIVSAACAAAIIDEVGAPNLRFLCDLYHLARMGVDLYRAIENFAPYIGHVQIADAPERSRPGTGTLDFESLFAALDAVGYDGWIGLEYKDPEHDWSWIA